MSHPDGWTGEQRRIWAGVSDGAVEKEEGKFCSNKLAPSINERIEQDFRGSSQIFSPLKSLGVPIGAV
jgi:hypothetical protein